MESKTNGLPLERLLLLLIIGIGCLGLTYAFRSAPAPIQAQQDYTQPLEINGSFTVGAPIRFTLSKSEFLKQKVEIDFGNGTQRMLKDSSFTFAYAKEGQYVLKIKQNNRVLYRTTVYISESEQYAQL